jgi:diaminohydroxyphosphoribosylaminopyrimidine deaminase / 5-amino-6-(5-phosphoribosylamino)uracil reductase
MNHEPYMLRCIQLAQAGLGNVAPNPIVGSVIVHDGKIIGEGYHQKYGEAHAEVNAIRSVVEKYPDAGELLKRSTLYVNLEPCSHFGKTPPCSDLIIHHQIPEVVIGNTDPFESVNGKGIEKLRKAGVVVTTGILEDECKELNKRFFTFHQKRRPYVILKWAQTKDGIFAPEDRSSHWITNELSKKLVHKWRSEEQAVLVGTTTALRDDPALNVRLWEGKNPVRVVIDKDLKLPSSLKIFDRTSPTLIFNAVKDDLQENTRWIKMDFDLYLPQFILYQLYLMDIQSVIIEGGAYTLSEFIKFNLWDEARVFIAESLLDKGIKAPTIEGRMIKKEMIASDELHIIRNL